MAITKHKISSACPLVPPCSEQPILDQKSEPGWVSFKQFKWVVEVGSTISSAKTQGNKFQVPSKAGSTGCRPSVKYRLEGKDLWQESYVYLRDSQRTVKVQPIREKRDGVQGSQHIRKNPSPEFTELNLLYTSEDFSLCLSLHCSMLAFS